MKLAASVGAFFLCLGVTLIVVGVIVGGPHVGIEGAYFNRSIGAPAYAGVYATNHQGLLDPSDGNLWLGAGVALVVATCGSLLVLLNRSRALPD